MSGEAAAPPPAPAATVLLLRDGPGGLQVYMTLRAGGLAFLGGYAVFPGGALDPADAAPSALARCRGLPGEEARRVLGPHQSAARFPPLAYWVAACREVFEETGVLLAAPGAPGGRMPEAERLPTYRLRLQRGEDALASLLEDFDLYIPAGDMPYLGHRITPPGLPTRYDTRFFLARLPDGQDPVPYRREVAAAAWVTPREALRRGQAGEWRLASPTRASLRALLDLPDVATALQRYGHGSTARRILPVLRRP